MAGATRANIDQHVTSIQLVEVGFAGAQYEMRRPRGGLDLSFAVRFQLDEDGLWRLKELQDTAAQMASCRVNPVPLLVARDDVIYSVTCRHGDDRAERQIGLRQDHDGVWRLTAI